MNPVLNPLRPVRAVIEFLGGLTYLLIDTFVMMPTALLSKRGRRLGWQNLWAQMDRVGVRSVPIVFLVLFCIGAILALQMAPILREYGKVDSVADVISVAIFRELGPLVSAIVLTGFAGASIAAEMGTMVVSEEIEALEAHAINPIRFLVVPRVLATTVMTVCIAIVGDTAGILGGVSGSQWVLGLRPQQDINHTVTNLKMKDFVAGPGEARGVG